jgi:hypothetical protein
MSVDAMIQVIAFDQRSPFPISRGYLAKTNGQLQGAIPAPDPTVVNLSSPRSYYGVELVVLHEPKKPGAEEGGRHPIKVLPDG